MYSAFQTRINFWFTIQYFRSLPPKRKGPAMCDKVLRRNDLIPRFRNMTFLHNTYHSTIQKHSGKRSAFVLYVKP